MICAGFAALRLCRMGRKFNCAGYLLLVESSQSELLLPGISYPITLFKEEYDG
jgi:hypothetical protein